MDRQNLYDLIADRKSKPKDFHPYDGGNGRVNKCADLIRSGKLRRGGTLLDIGGGIGDLGYATRDFFEKRIVLDISETNLDAAAAKGNEVILTDVDRHGLADLYDASVDLVTALDFIEHIIDPENFARECYRVLKSGGDVFVNTPNIRYWRHIQQLWFDGRFPHTSGDREVYHGGHLAFFTFSDLDEIFTAAGFVGSEQFKDEECYEQPPFAFLEPLRPTNQMDYVAKCLELGCPNLLFKTTKP